MSVSLNNLIIELENSPEVLPGQLISGVIRWNALAEHQPLELRLFWFTSPKAEGTAHSKIVATMSVNAFGNGNQRFEFTLPHEPFSFSGQLFSLSWAIEFINLSNLEFVRKELIVSPSRKIIELPKETQKN